MSEDAFFSSRYHRLVDLIILDIWPSQPNLNLHPYLATMRQMTHLPTVNSFPPPAPLDT
jgi:hypothetical protein